MTVSASAQDLQAQLARLTPPRALRLATRSTPEVPWSQLVVPGQTHGHLEDLIRRVRRRVGVQLRWGMGRGRRGRSVVGLLDGTLPPEEVELVNTALHGVCAEPRVEITDVRTRESGRQRFVYATVTVPGEWTVKRSHDVADQVEDAVDAELPGTRTFVHIEPSRD